MARQPNLFILGAPKCGTTSLAHWLGGHPHVYLSPVKEPHHYNQDDYRADYPDRERYLALFDGARPEHRYRLEASTWYLHSRVAVPAILQDCPQARFIVCLRNPVDMAFSLHGHFVSKTAREHVRSFEQAWALSERRLRGEDVVRRARNPSHLAYKYACRLGEQVSRLQREAPPDRVHFVVLDDLKASQQETLRGLLAFLGLAPELPLALPVDNARKDARYPAVELALKGVENLKLRFNMTGLSTGAGRLLSRLNAAPEPGGLSAPMREQLTRYFEDDIHLLWRVVGRRYPQWLNPIGDDDCGRPGERDARRGAGG